MFNTDESRAGAIACIDALRIIEHIAESGGHQTTDEQYIRAQKTALMSVSLAAGEMSQRAQGVLMAIAEYVYHSMESGTPYLDKWRPIASMTGDEQVTYNARFTEEASHV